MLLGTYQPTLIDKNRLALPSKLRREIKGNQLILSVGMEDCIFGFEEEKWEQVTAADLSRPISLYFFWQLRPCLFRFPPHKPWPD